MIVNLAVDVLVLHSKMTAQFFHDRNLEYMLNARSRNQLEAYSSE